MASKVKQYNVRQVTEVQDNCGNIMARRTDEWFDLDYTHLVALERVLVVENSENMVALGERKLEGKNSKLN